MAGPGPALPLQPPPHPSQGPPCRTGDSVLSVDGDGNVRRRHFADTPPGNLHGGSFAARLGPRAGPLTSRNRHTGYVRPESLDLYGVFRGGVAERIPAAPVTALPLV